MAVLASSTLVLYCWTGRYSDKPSQPQYTIVKSNPDSNNVIRFEISELIQDYINVIFNNDYTVGVDGLSNIKSTCWWYYEKQNSYTDRDADTEHTAYGLATKGYTYFEDGINSTLSSSKLFSNEFLYYPEGAIIHIPVYIGPNGVSNVKFYSKDSLGNEYVSDSVAYTLQSNIPASEDSNTYIRYALSAVKATKIEIVSANQSAPGYSTDTEQAIETVYPIYTCNTKYTNHKVCFINKFGAFQDLYFVKKREDSLDVKRDSFDTSTVTSSSSSANYNTYDPTNIVQDVTSKKSLTLSTGFVKDEYNETMRELFQSENVFIREDNRTIPIKVKDSSFTYKTHLNDKLVNYTVQFEYAFEGINNVR
mgnify:FL=1